MADKPIVKVPAGQNVCCWCGHSLENKTIVGAGDGTRTGATGAFAHTDCYRLGIALDAARDHVIAIEASMREAADGWKPAVDTAAKALPDDPGQTLFD